jgi:hypothetical protein
MIRAGMSYRVGRPVFVERFHAPAGLGACSGCGGRRARQWGAGPEVDTGGGVARADSFRPAADACSGLAGRLRRGRTAGGAARTGRAGTSPVPGPEHRRLRERPRRL